MYRFLIQNQDLNTDIVNINDKREVHHLRNVLRLKNGDEITVFNGNGQDAVGIITHVSDSMVDVSIKKTIEHKLNKSQYLTLACAIPKKSKFETIIEKCTELGIDHIIPLQTERTEIKLKGDRLVKKRERYQAVAINAAKQSKRLTVPLISPAAKFSEFINNIDGNSACFIPCLTGKRTPIKEALKKAKNAKIITFIIGPEGDFTPDEVKSALKAGCLPVTLGDTVLKVETAAISVIAYTKFSSNAS